MIDLPAEATQHFPLTCLCGTEHNPVTRRVTTGTSVMPSMQGLREDKVNHSTAASSRPGRLRSAGVCVCERDRLFQLNDDKLADLTLINHTNTKHNSNQNDFYVVSRQVVRLVCYLLCSSVLQRLNDNN